MSLDSGTFEATIKFDYLSNLKFKNSDIMDCYFVEDIYSMATFGKISVFDNNYGLKEYGPLTGDEKLLISYGSTSLIERVFTIYKISKIEGITGFKRASISVINLFFVDVYYNNLVMKKFSKSWDENVDGSTIIEDIVKNMLKIESSDLNIEKSTGKLGSSFYIPQWNAAETIRYLSNRLMGTKGKYGYLFFSNSQKYINYVTLDGLLKNAPVDNEIYLFDTTDISYENIIKAWEVMGVDHTGVKELGGGQLLGFDSNTKSFLGIAEDEEFIYSKAIKKVTSLGNSSLFDGNTIDNKPKESNYVYYNEGESDKTILSNMFYNNFIRRYSLHNMVKLMVIGHDKRFIGQKIEIMWPSINSKEIFNSMDSGQYLIKSITNSFAPQSIPMFKQTLVLIKNAYNNSKTGSNSPTLGFNLFDFILGKS